MRYALSVQYVGKNYAGSQIQLESGLESKQTVQGELEKAICTLIYGAINCPVQNNRPIKTFFSGRTDSGVNSTGQMVHFDSDKSIVASSFVYSLNEILPSDISVSDLRIVPDTFHAQKSAVSRHYRYEFITRKCKNAFDGDLPRVKYEVDIDRINKSLSYLLGEHDFSSFKSSGGLNPSKICFLSKAEAKQCDDRIVIDIVGNRFLYNMIRTIVGTLLEIEGHSLEPEYMLEVLNAKSRAKAGKTVSPYGLTLVKVSYS